MNTDNILAVLVLYKCKLEESDTFLSLSKALKYSNLKIDLYVYDNSPESDFNKLDYSDFNVELIYIHNSNNPGVSKAYNEGGAFATNVKKKWLLLLDQDTFFNNNYFDVLFESITINDNSMLFVPTLKANNIIISPCNYYFRKGLTSDIIHKGKVSCNNKSVLNSGIFIKLSEFNRIGGYNNNVTLYFSDFVFFNRYKKDNKNFVVLNTVIEHGLSDVTDQTIENLTRTYKLFCNGAKQASFSFLDYMQYFFLTIARGIILTIRLKTFIFIKLFYKEFIK